MSTLFIGLKDVSLKDVGLKDFSLKNVVVPKYWCHVDASLALLVALNHRDRSYYDLYALNA